MVGSIGHVQLPVAIFACIYENSCFCPPIPSSAGWKAGFPKIAFSGQFILLVAPPIIPPPAGATAVGIGTGDSGTSAEVDGYGLGWSWLDGALQESNSKRSPSMG